MPFDRQDQHTLSTGCAKVVCIVIVARSAFLRSIVIFVKYSEVSTRTILPNFIGRDMD